MAKSERLEHRDGIYLSTVGFFFFGTPNCGSSLGEDKGVAPNIREALKPHSTETLDLAEAFQKLDIFAERPIDVYTYYETVTVGTLESPELGGLVSQAALAHFEQIYQLI
jgi:hypothetical protein